MKIKKFNHYLLLGVTLFFSTFIFGQMSYEEFHDRYKPNYQKIVPNSDLVKNINKMDTEKAASQLTNSTISAYKGNDDDQLSIVAVLTSCEREKVIAILNKMSVEHAVLALKLLKSEWIKEIMYFADRTLYQNLAPHLILQLFIPDPKGPFGPVLTSFQPAYGGVFYDYSISGLKGMNEILDNYGEQDINSLKGFGLMGAFYINKTNKKRPAYNLLEISYHNRSGKTNYESPLFMDSKFSSNTIALQSIKTTTGGGKFVFGQGWGLQANFVNFKATDLTSGNFEKLGGRTNFGINYNLQMYINPLKDVPLMIGVRGYTHLNLLKVDFNPLRDHLYNQPIGTSTDDDFMSSVSTFGFQIQALYRFGKQYVPKEYKSFDNELAETYDKNLNTVYNELTPRVSADGKTLYFVRENHPLNTKGSLSSQDLWVSDISNGINNATALHLEKPFNQNSYNSVVGVSPDGNSMVIKGRYAENGAYLGLGYTMLTRTKDGWSKPQELKVEGYSDMVKGTYVGGHWSADGKHLVLSLSENSDNDSQDIYVSHLKEDGTWTKPKSLGSIINTKGDENGPFLAADGKTLYFSSNREGGLGSNDIWMSQRQDDTWTNWSEPVNLGSDVNTAEWDSYYTIDAQGKYAYMVSYKNSKGGSADIIRIELKEDVQPDPVVLVRGKVLDQKTNLPVAAKISYNGISDGKNYGVANSNPETGEYTIVLPYGINYSFTASAANYIGVSDNLDLTKVGEYKEITRDLYLVPIEVGATVRLNNIFFETGKDELKEDSFVELDRVIQFLKENPKVTIEISGHTDNVGDKGFNKALSQKRADAVIKYLVENGIDKSRLEGKGYGMEKSVADNSTEEGKALNRRVEFTILSNN